MREPVRTRQQQWAQRAYDAVSARKQARVGDDYGSFCKGFPALIHQSGLCQALAFAQAKAGGHDGRSEAGQYLEDLARVLGLQRNEFADSSRSADVLTYQRLTQDALAAATWLKRYAEALLDDVKGNSNQ